MGSIDTDSLPAREERATASLSPATPAEGGAPARLLPGAVIGGKYRIERVLGSGGMGVVYEAMHLGVEERVALKFLSGSAGGTAVARLRREARIAMRLRSEHIARLMDISAIESGAPYLVMEHLEGKNLAEVLRAEGRLPVAAAVGHVLEACEAMAEAHGLGIVHRDLKPSNLFLTRRGDGTPLVKVLDFGIAKLTTGEASDSLTATTATLGSPLYMSPEQLRSAARADARSDVWSLGVVLHELLAGKTPFSGESAGAVLASIAADPPARLRAHRPDAPAALEAVIVRCLEKPPASRYPDVAALARALAPFAPAAGRARVERIEGLLAAGGPRPSAAPEEPAPPDPLPTGSTWSAGPAPARSDRRYLALGGLALALATGGALVWRGGPPASAPQSQERARAAGQAGSRASPGPPRPAEPDRGPPYPGPPAPTQSTARAPSAEGVFSSGLQPAPAASSTATASWAPAPVARPRRVPPSARASAAAEPPLPAPKLVPQEPDVEAATADRH